MPPPPAGELDGPPTVPLNENRSAPPPMPPAEPPPPNNSSKTWLIVAGVLLVICCLLVVCAVGGVAIFNSSRSYLPLPFGRLPTDFPNNPSPVVEATVAPTDTERPEASPTPTEEVIPTSTTQLSVAAYGQAVSTPLKAFSKALTDLGGLMKQVSPDPSMLLDDTWRANVRSNAAIVKASHATIAALYPPDALADMHATLIGGTGDCSRAMDHLTTGIDNQDEDEITVAINLINSCNDKVSLAETKLDEYLKNH